MVRILRRRYWGLILAFIFTASQSASADLYEDAVSAQHQYDFSTALRLYRVLAKQGDVRAWGAIGWMYANGQGVPTNYVEALKWYRIAAQRREASAQFNLGDMYANGFGVQQDYVRAHMWRLLSNFSSSGFENKMTRDGIALAQEMVDICRKSGYVQCGEPEIVSAEIIISQLPDASSSLPTPAKTTSMVPLQIQGGTFVVAVLINGAITLNFTLDSGAADVTIPRDVVTTLMRTGTIKKSDFLGKRTYVLADGSKINAEIFRIRSMKVGDRIIENVTGSVTPVDGSLLLGQSFLSRLRSWTVDNKKRVLLLDYK